MTDAKLTVELLDKWEGWAKADCLNTEAQLILISAARAFLESRGGPWVAVSDRLPPTGCSVMVDGGCAYFDGIDWRTLMGASHRKIEWEVTHWMPLPAPPEPTNG